MLITQKVVMRWNSKNKARFESLGYVFTKMRDEFLVDVSHLSDSSDAIVEVKCDYCNTIIPKPWYRHLKENEQSEIKKDCCNNCKKIKIQETSFVKYGVKSVFSHQSTKEKIAQTNIEKFGVENPFQSKEIQERIYDTNMKKYGTKVAAQSKAIQSKISSTCMDRYGVPYYICTQVFSGDKNPRWKGGVKYHRQERSTTEYINWRKSVYERDKYTCQCCLNKSRKGNPVVLIAHHIKNWKDNVDDRYDVENGITLCEDCHIEFHKQYGRTNNNKSQIEQFLLNHGKKVC